MWTPEIAAAFNLPEEQPEPQAEGNGARVVDDERPDHALGLPIPGGGWRSVTIPGLTIPGGDREHLDFIDGIEIHLLANKVFKDLAETNEYFVQSQSRKLVRYDRTEPPLILRTRKLKVKREKP